jgi:hypothetical protein
MFYIQASKWDDDPQWPRFFLWMKAQAPSRFADFAQDFSNRSHKAVIIVTGVILEHYESLLIGLGNLEHDGETCFF